MSRYRPVFEYEDSDGNIKTYTRKKSIERTPFTEKESYIIIHSKHGIYEASERLISDRFCFLCLKVAMILSTIIFPSLFLFMCILSTLTTAAFITLPGLIKQKIGHGCFGTEKIDGKITGYQKLKRKDDNGNSLYRPIIEYSYRNQIYTHMSKIVCEENAYGLMTVCEIFICNNKKIVYDVFEVNQPIVDFDKMKKIFIQKKNNESDMKIYSPRKVTSSNFKNGDTMPINVPLRTLPYKASGWY